MACKMSRKMTLRRRWQRHVLIYVLRQAVSSNPATFLQRHQAFHLDLMSFVWQPVTGSTYTLSWLTVWWMYYCGRTLKTHVRPPQWSDQIVVPGRMWVWIISWRTTRWREGTSCIKNSFVARSTPPNIHCCHTARPWALPGFLRAISLIDGHCVPLAADRPRLVEQFCRAQIRRTTDAGVWHL